MKDRTGSVASAARDSPPGLLLSFVLFLRVNSTFTASLLTTGRGIASDTVTTTKLERVANGDPIK